MSFIFDKLAPPPHPDKRFKISFKFFLVYFCAKDSLRSANNVVIAVFLLFCILVGWLLVRAKALPP